MSDSLRPHELYGPWNSPGQNIAVGSLSLLQGIFPTPGSRPGLPHCRQSLYQLSPQGSPRMCKGRRKTEKVGPTQRLRRGPQRLGAVEVAAFSEVCDNERREAAEGKCRQEKTKGKLSWSCSVCPLPRSALHSMLTSPREAALCGLTPVTLTKQGWLQQKYREQKRKRQGVYSALLRSTESVWAGVQSCGCTRACCSGPVQLGPRNLFPPCPTIYVYSPAATDP